MKKSINFLVLSYNSETNMLVLVSRHRSLSRAQKAATKAERKYGHSVIQQWTNEDRDFINQYFSPQGMFPIQSF